MTATNVSGNSTFNFVLTVSTLAPNLTADSPLSVPQNASRSYSATNIGGVATSWSWNFGGGASPNTSTASNPTVTITGTNGSTYNCSVTATNGGGNSTFNFIMTVTMPLPNITSVTPLSGPSGANQSFSLINAGGAISTYSWNFGGGATPNTSTSANPTVKFGAKGVYNGTVTATNAAGTSTPFNFSYSVNEKWVQVHIRVVTNGTTPPAPLGGMASWSKLNFYNWFVSNVQPTLSDAGVFSSNFTIMSYATVNNPHSSTSTPSLKRTSSSTSSSPMAPVRSGSMW